MGVPFHPSQILRSRYDVVTSRYDVMTSRYDVVTGFRHHHQHILSGVSQQAQDTVFMLTTVRNFDDAVTTSKVPPTRKERARQQCLQTSLR